MHGVLSPATPKTHPVAGLQLAVWQLPGVHETAPPPVQTPAWHMSFCVQALPSLHGVPVSGVGVQVCVLGLQVPAE